MGSSSSKESHDLHLCDDVVSVILGFLNFRETAFISPLNQQLFRVFKRGYFWKEYFMRIFSPTFYPIPKKYEGKLTTDFFRICFLSVVKGSSWRFDKKSVVGDFLQVSNQLKDIKVNDTPLHPRISPENINEEQVYEGDKYDDDSVVFAKPFDAGKNRSVSTKTKYTPTTPKQTNDNVETKKIHFEILEIETLIATRGNYSMGIANENFVYDSNFIGYGNPITNKKSIVRGKVSYGYSSDGSIRKNYQDGYINDTNLKKTERYNFEHITMVWQKPDISNPNYETHKIIDGKLDEGNDKTTCSFSADLGNGHNIFWFKNGECMGYVREDFEIRTKVLRPTLTLYNGIIGDVNAIRIVTKDLVIPFWDVVFPLIVKDFGLENLIIEDEV